MCYDLLRSHVGMTDVMCQRHRQAQGRASDIFTYDMYFSPLLSPLVLRYFLPVTSSSTYLAVLYLL